MAKWWSVDHFIFEEYKTSTRSLGTYRILFAAYIVLLVLPEHLWVSRFPDSFLDPPTGLTLFFRGFPSAWFFLVANALAIMAGVGLLFGYRTRVASVSLALLMLVLNYWAYSFGKIDHDIFLILIPLLLQHAGWGNAYSVDASQRAKRGAPEGESRAWPIALMALMVGIGMMSAALPKLASGWLDPHTHAVRAHLLYNTFVTGRTNWFAEHALQIQSGVFWESLDYGTVLLEGAFLLTVFSRRAFYVVCALACFFHLGIALTMEIAFTGNIVAYAAVCDWSGVPARAGSVFHVWDRILSRLSGPLVLSLGAALAASYLRFGNPFQLPIEWDPIGVAICLLACLAATIFLGRMLRNWFWTPGRSVILFDGFCGLCNGWVDFVLRHDQRSLYKFAALQSPVGQEILQQLGLPSDFVDSFVLVEDQRAYFQSSAVLRALRGLGFPYALASACVVVPPALRNWIYRFVAAHRFDWFGKRTTCRIPTPEEAARFL
jgi:predicted DCC family thiol-disulfide oxidoreductase YuxK/uncharacterized membrane protein YphA (DoxX/SURF4 family)